MLPEQTVDRFSHHGIEPFIFTIGLVPVLGIGAAVGSFAYSVPNWERNPYNLARQAAFTAYIVLAVQTVYLVVGLVMFL